jgi:fumarate reductase subunit C
MYAPGEHEALHAAHTVSFTLLHADTWYRPAPQALHSLHTVSSM